MLDRLNGWQRIGVVITAIWIVLVLLAGAEGLATIDSNRGPFVEHIAATPADCTKPIKRDPNKRTFTLEEAYGCAEDGWVGGTPESGRFNTLAFLIVLFLPPVLAWTAAYALIATIRWIAQGFRGHR